MWEETATLLTTYSLFLEMLFGNENEHLGGVDEVRRELLVMARIKQRLTPSFYTNMICAILNGMAKHFNECMSINDFDGSQFGLVWPRTDLKGFANQMRALQDIKLLTLLDKWNDAISNNRQYKIDSPYQGGGGGDRGGGKGGAGSGGDRNSPQKEGRELNRHNNRDDDPEK